MQKIEGRLTVFFEDPFWVGVFERQADGKLAACKITFGAEPKDYEVYEFLLQSWSRLRFSLPVKAGGPEAARISPKRMQRQIRRQLAQPGVGTKAQQAMKLQQEEGKATRKKKSRLEREAEKERLYLLRQGKKKQKHRGH